MPEIFVTPEWVAAARTNSTVVDVRREDQYSEGHLPGAVNIPFDRFRDPTGEMEGKLPTPMDFASLLSEAGIASNDRIVAYDGDHGVYASRFLVTARVFGHDLDQLYLLNGDFDNWARTHRTTLTVPTTRATDYTCQRRSGDPLVGASELEEALGTDAVIVDTRDPLEYDVVHLPGAVNFQWRSLIDGETGQLKPRTEKEVVLEAHEITPDRPIRLYCNTARRLSFVYAVLRELGYDDVAFYEGGIDAWAEYGGPFETTPS
ncbi:MAG: sulfurtransferase [Halobacteriales archaeon]